ncbi:MAG: tyrosine-type recombinase/integrase, partial [Cyanobium sp.]
MSPSTQSQALSALLLLYRELLERDLDLEGVVRARKPQRLPVVLTEEEVRSVLQRLEGSEALVAGLLYGSGLRLMEDLRLRVHDLDFQRLQITVRQGKGGKDRRTMLPALVAKRLQDHLQVGDCPVAIELRHGARGTETAALGEQESQHRVRAQRFDM